MTKPTEKQNGDEADDLKTRNFKTLKGIIGNKNSCDIACDTYEYLLK